MSGKQFNFDETIGYTRKTFGAKPDKITDPSQLPTVKIPDSPIIAEPDSGNNSKYQSLPVTINASGHNHHSQEMPVTKSDTVVNSHYQTVPLLKNGTVKHVSGQKSKDQIVLNMRLKTSVDCLRMYYLIHELSEKHDSNWIEITRVDFEENGVRGGKIVGARQEGLERELFEYREIKDISKQTNKEYVKGYEYKLITQ